MREPLQKRRERLEKTVLPKLPEPVRVLGTARRMRTAALPPAPGCRGRTAALEDPGAAR